MSSTSVQGRSVIKEVYANRVSEGDGAKVRRSIGSMGLRNLTPFLMLDHFEVQEGGAFPDHPHRGQTTVTYMLQGQFQHEDFEGHRGIISPGDLQWMTAGRGIMHAEMPIHKPGQSDPEGLQLWIDLPKEHKNIAPSYQEKKASEVATVTGKKEDGQEGVEVTVVSGKSMGVEGPVRPVDGCWYFDFKLKKGAKFFQELPEGWTGYIYLLSGTIKVGSPTGTQTTHTKHHGLVLSSSASEPGVWLESAEESDEVITRGILLAGAPLDQKVVQYGPFVTTSVEEARQAIVDFQTGQNGFEKAPNWKSEIAKEWNAKRAAAGRG